jgi:hypothetical protein
VTGPEHYRAAEQLLIDAMHERDGSAEQTGYVAAAQVHATLAHTAGTLFAAIIGKMPIDVDPEGDAATDWFAAISPEGTPLR